MNVFHQACCYFTAESADLASFKNLPAEADVTIGFSQDELRGPIADADVILNGMNGGDLFKALLPTARERFAGFIPLSAEWKTF